MIKGHKIIASKLPARKHTHLYLCLQKEQNYTFQSKKKINEEKYQTGISW